MSDKLSQINELLCRKSATKQSTYKITQEVFKQIKSVMQDLQNDILPCLKNDAPNVEVRFDDKGDFEAHLRFSGDTIVVMLHTNIFDFDDAHFISKTPYIKENPLNVFCGMIQIYNFLSDSIRYNREHDAGYLVGRIFINRERKFFIEGKRPLAFKYGAFSTEEITSETIRTILEESILFCLNFDLQAPPLDAINYITLEQKNLLSYSSGIPTHKQLGFKMSSEADVE